MKIGDMVTFKTAPTENTPGATPDAVRVGVGWTGFVVAENSGNDNPEALDFFDGRKWCEVLWPDEQVTRCYKEDLRVWKPRRRRPQMRCVKMQ